MPMKLLSVITLLAISTNIIAINDGSSNGPSSDDASSNVGSVIVNVANVGDVALMTFGHWKTQTDSQASPTVKMTSQSSNDPLSFSLTFIPSEREQPMGENEQKKTVRQIAAKYVDSSIEQRVILKRLRTPIGTAILANFNEKKFEFSSPPPGELPSITIGLIAHEKMMVSVTILTNGPDSEAHDDALAVLNSILVIDKSLAQ
jgi:hypothetical protein